MRLRSKSASIPVHIAKKRENKKRPVSNQTFHRIQSINDTKDMELNQDRMQLRTKPFDIQFNSNDEYRPPKRLRAEQQPPKVKTPKNIILIETKKNGKEKNADENLPITVLSQEQQSIINDKATETNENDKSNGVAIGSNEIIQKQQQQPPIDTENNNDIHSKEIAESLSFTRSLKGRVTRSKTSRATLSTMPSQSIESERNENDILNDAAIVSAGVSAKIQEQQQQPSIDTENKNDKHSEEIVKSLLSTRNLRSRAPRLKNSEATSSTMPTNNDNKKHKESRVVRRVELKRSGNFSIGDIVLVKWPSYPYWPGRIIAIINKKIEVIFFGDNSRTANVQENRVFDYAINFEYIVMTLKCRQWKSMYYKAIRETEIYAGISSEISLTNAIDL